MAQIQVKGSDPDFTLREALRWAACRLASAELDAELLLAHVLGKPRSYLFGHPDARLSAGEQRTFADLVERRCNGEPIAYLTGNKGFWSLDLTVTSAVLVPRPETELLVELALGLIPADADWRVADLGTGSGAIALALAAERPRLAVTATDTDPGALAVAEANAERLGLNIEFRRGDWFEALAGERFDLLISNPPYVAENDPHLDDLAYEPRGALTAGEEGLDALRIIAAGAGDYLRSAGRLLLEHGADQGAAVRNLLENAGFEAVKTHPDLAGRERATLGSAPRA